MHRILLRRKDVPSFDQYPFNVPVIRGLEAIELHPKVTYFIGENGTGKSTLIEALAVAAGFNAEGGSKNFNFSTASAHAALHEYITLQRGARREKDGFFLRAESFFNVATQVDELGATHNYGDRSLHSQSHGESYIALAVNRMRGHGLYIMDEPESALSPIRQLSMLKIIHRLVTDSASQFVIATHSPILMAYPDALIYSLDTGTPTPIAYDEVEHVQITRSFMTRPERFLRELFEG